MLRHINNCIYSSYLTEKKNLSMTNGCVCGKYKKQILILKLYTYYLLGYNVEIINTCNSF